MFFDLNVAWDPRRSPAVVDLAFRLGFSAVAHTVTLAAGNLQPGDLQAQRAAIVPCKAPTGSGNVARRGGGGGYGLGSVGTGRSGPLFGALGASLNVDPEQSGPLVQLRRLTLTVADTAQLNTANQAARLRPGFDLVAVRPTTEEAFQATCERGDCDIVSLRLDERLPFPLRRKDVLLFLKRGGFFEVEFAPTLRDPGRRKHVFANVEQLTRAARGAQNVFFTSAATDAMELRSPHDLANFAAVLGLRGARSLQSVGDVPLRAMQRGALRRGGATQVVARLGASTSADDKASQMVD